MDNTVGLYRFQCTKCHCDTCIASNRQNGAHKTFRKYGAIACILDYWQFEL